MASTFCTESENAHEALRRRTFNGPPQAIISLSLFHNLIPFPAIFVLPVWVPIFFPLFCSAPRMLDGFESLPEAMFMNYLWSLCCIHEYNLPSLICSWHPETIFDLFFNFSHSLISHFIVSYFIECTAPDLSMFPRYQWRRRCFLCGPFKYFFFSFCYLCSTVSLVAFCGIPIWKKSIYWIELKEPEGNLNVVIVFDQSCSNFPVWGEKRRFIYLIASFYWS